MKFINASMMPRLDYFVRGRSVPAESVWMDECWRDNQAADFGQIDEVGHTTRANEVSPDVEFIHLMHERGNSSGRHLYDILEHSADAFVLFQQAYKIFKNRHADKLIGFYDQYDALRLGHMGVDVFDRFAPHNKDSLRCFDFFMPRAYLDAPLPEFVAAINYKVEWLRSRSRSPIYLCATHKTRPPGKKDFRYMSPAEMDVYLSVLQESGADGVIWWAWNVEGTNNSNGEGTTNKSLKLKAWNHKWRYKQEENAWAEAFMDYTWES